MLTPTEAAWLAGFLDADGCIRLSKGTKNSKLNQHSLIPQLLAHNTCVVTLNRVLILFEKMGALSVTSLRKRYSAQHAKMANILSLGMKRVEPILREILPYLVTKRLEAELMLRFIELRKSRRHRNAPYTASEYRIYTAMKYLKKSRHLRDYTPTVEEILDQDIVRTSAKALEEAEMSSRLTAEQQSARAAKMVWYRKDRTMPL